MEKYIKALWFKLILIFVLSSCLHKNSKKMKLDLLKSRTKKIFSSRDKFDGEDAKSQYQVILHSDTLIGVSSFKGNFYINIDDITYCCDNVNIVKKLLIGTKQCKHTYIIPHR